EKTLKPVPQVEDEHTYAKLLSKAIGEIDFSKSAEEIERLIRGLNPWPSAYTYMDGKLLKIWDAEVIREEKLSEREKKTAPGSVAAVGKESFSVRTGSGILRVLEVQLEGKKRMKSAEFLRGYTLLPEKKFGKEADK
ncbi:MAG: methionyl-tRNA formyltransferase, partial [Lachnospiraceae bacterium]|nr:methionyl-tRNA formyltransferase [Lachnospiraceae bacterium]